MEVFGRSFGYRRQQEHHAVALAPSDDGSLHVLARAPYELHTLKGFSATCGDGLKTSVSSCNVECVNVEMMLWPPSSCFF